MVRRRLRSRLGVTPDERGALLVEALVVSVVVTIALLGTIGLINISTQQRNRAAERNQLNAAIDADLAAIEDLASQLTCCSGACTLGVAAFDSTPPFTTPCFTDNRRDDRYFYPQIDIGLGQAGNQDERELVDAICQEPIRGIISDAVLAQFNNIDDDGLTAAGVVRLPIVRLRTVEDQPGNQNILQVTYTDNNAADPIAPVRVARVVPPMARFCP